MRNSGKLVENIFSSTFSRVQLNSQKYCSKHFLKQNQTFLEF